MYVTAGTTQRQIREGIAKAKEELDHNRFLTAEDRAALREEIEYLESFIEEVIKEWQHLRR